jgi:hypothetical protein
MAYTVHMRLSATDFRKNLFTVLEKALAGENVEVVYKGSSLRVSGAGAGSKLARAKRQDLFLCDPDSVVSSDKEQLAEFEKEWAREWKSL